MSKELLSIVVGSRHVLLEGKQLKMFKSLETFPFVCATCAGHAVDDSPKNASGTLKHLLDKKVVKRFKSKDCPICNNHNIRSIYYPRDTSLSLFSGTIIASSPVRKILKRTAKRKLKVTELKICSKCKHPFPHSAFSKSASTEDKLQRWCRKCQHDYYHNWVKNKKGKKTKKKSTKIVTKKVDKDKYFVIDALGNLVDEYPNLKTLESSIDMSDYNNEIRIIKGKVLKFKARIVVEDGKD